MVAGEVDTGKRGKREDFEASAAHLLPKDPVARRKTPGVKREGAEIS